MPDRPTDIPADTADTAGQAGPTWVGRTERGRAADLAVPERFVAARLLVCDGGVPVGQVELPLTGGRVSASAIDAAASAAGGHVPQPPPVSGEPMTVVVATRGRPESLQRCVRAVLAGDHPALTVVVVDNDPPDDLTERAVRSVADPRVRYVREPRRGASAGRNRGLAEARTPVVAFTDDDTEPDTAWASRIAGAFAADPELAGLSRAGARGPPGDPAGAGRGRRAGLEQGLRPPALLARRPAGRLAGVPVLPGPVRHRREHGRPRVTRCARSAGSTRRSARVRATAGGEDIELLVRIVLDGQVLGYVPSAFVWHHHRPSDAELRSQMRGYALGLGAFLGKVALDPRARCGRPAAACRPRWRGCGTSCAASPATPRTRRPACTSRPATVRRGRRARAPGRRGGAQAARPALRAAALPAFPPAGVRQSGGAAPPLTRPEDGSG